MPALLVRVLASVGGTFLRIAAWIVLFPLITSFMRNLVNPNSSLRFRFHRKNTPPKSRRKGDPVKAKYEILDQQEVKPG